MTVGTPAWLTQSGGILSGAERVRLMGRIGAEAPMALAHRVHTAVWVRGRGNQTIGAIDTLPATTAAGLAQAACRQHLSQAFVNHSFRTWIFGMALARRDDQHQLLDSEAFFVAAMLHDLGLGKVQFDRCFTAVGVAEVAKIAAATSRELPAAACGISDHITPGVSRRTNPYGFYLQRASLLDLTGVRAACLPRSFVRAVFEAYPPFDIKREAPARWRAEAAMVRHGRADLVQRWGRFSLMARTSPLPPRR